ncbi:hypothetical protein [Bradyrhizobium genosp. P]|uniref:hypothetical protein n=1 Tax=Bradyrhizobium genosp. P TaxID=83641 RepID=UPI003CEF9146
MSTTKTKTKQTSPAVTPKTAPGFFNPPVKRGAALQAAMYTIRKKNRALRSPAWK